MRGIISCNRKKEIHLPIPKQIIAVQWHVEIEDYFLS